MRDQRAVAQATGRSVPAKSTLFVRGIGDDLNGGLPPAACAA